MKFIMSQEKWNKMNQPDVGSKIYLRDKKTSKKNYFTIEMINYGHKKGIEMSLKRIK